MKIKFSFLMLMAVVFMARAQDETVYKNVIQKVTSSFNSRDYAGIYNLLSDDFKKQVPQKDFTAFLAVQEALGTITATEHVGDKDGFRIYKTTFNKGTLSMLLACNAQSQITGFALRPYTQTAAKNILWASDNKKSTALDIEVDKAVSDFMGNPDNAGAVIAVVSGDDVFYYHYGEATKGMGKLPDNNTIFEIGSISKTFTGILLAQAVVDKKLSLDDDIRKYLPGNSTGMELDGKPILIKHLANHTSGLPKLTDDLDTTPGYDKNDPYKHYTRQMYFDYLARVKLKSTPGSKQEYSNTGVAVLGLILQKVYGQTYEQLLNTYISKPFKMVNTFTIVPEKQLNNFATGYADGTVTPHWNLADSNAAGGIRSTIADMALYLKANMADATPAIKLSHNVTFGTGQQATGLNWFMPVTKNGDTLLWHNGGTGGFSSYMGYLKNKKVGVVVLVNSASPGDPDKIGMQVLKYLQQ
jgi:CubicO group peptidase (beta-lactamase class C family)